LENYFIRTSVESEVKSQVLTLQEILCKDAISSMGEKPTVTS
jgi:hypothetical protein